MSRILIVIVIGYLFGCFQTSYIIGRLIKKVDIRELGNGNAGASNTTVSLGWKYGILVGLIDILKAIFSILIIKYLFGTEVSKSFLLFLLYLNGLFVIIGHDYPFYLGFRGGKGTASLVGMLLIIDIRLGLIGILTIVLVTIITDYIALGTMGLLVSLILGTIILNPNPGNIIVAFSIAALSVYKHIPNIRNIVDGTENGLKKALNR